MQKLSCVEINSLESKAKAVDMNKTKLGINSPLPMVSMISRKAGLHCMMATWERKCHHFIFFIASSSQLSLGWSGVSLCSAGVPCPSCIPSQPLAHPILLPAGVVRSSKGSVWPASVKQSKCHFDSPAWLQPAMLPPCSPVLSALYYLTGNSRGRHHIYFFVQFSCTVVLEKNPCMLQLMTIK